VRTAICDQGRLRRYRNGGSAPKPPPGASPRAPRCEHLTTDTPFTAMHLITDGPHTSRAAGPCDTRTSLGALPSAQVSKLLLSYLCRGRHRPVASPTVARQGRRQRHAPVHARTLPRTSTETPLGALPKNRVPLASSVLPKGLQKPPGPPRRALLGETLHTMPPENRAFELARILGSEARARPFAPNLREPTRFACARETTTRY
jgi:hypothetical protein